MIPKNELIAKQKENFPRTPFIMQLHEMEAG